MPIPKNSKAMKSKIIRNNKSSDTTKRRPELLLPKKWKKIPRKNTFFFDMGKMEFLKSKKWDYMLDFIPSKTTRSKIDDADQFTKNVDVHIEALEKLITGSFNFVRNYEFLISSAKEVLRLARCCIKDTISPPFNFMLRRYPSNKTYCRDPDLSAYVCNLAKNGCARVYLDSPWIDQMDFLPSALTVLVSFQKGYYLPLNIKESKIWLEFKKLDKGNPESLFTNSTFDEEKEKRSINLSYPLVGVIGGFAVAAFNKACAMIKKDEHNIHDFEYMECKYVKDSKGYFFYMTIEAIEEGNLGVYEAIVACSRDDGVRTLLKFVLTDRTPVGTKAMAISLLSCLRSLMRALRNVNKEKACEHERIHRYASGIDRGIALNEMGFLVFFNRESMRGIERVICLNLQLFFQPDCTRRSAPDDWLPLCCNNIGIVPRNIGTPCRGYDYDYYNQYLAQYLSI